MNEQSPKGTVEDLWISVNDRMPERDPEEPSLSVTAIIWATEDENPENGFMTFACFSEAHQDWLDNGPLGSMGHTVTHWQPAPEPPAKAEKA